MNKKFHHRHPILYIAETLSFQFQNCIKMEDHLIRTFYLGLKSKESTWINTDFRYNSFVVNVLFPHDKKNHKDVFYIGYPEFHPPNLNEQLKFENKLEEHIECEIKFYFTDKGILEPSKEEKEFMTQTKK